MNIGNNPKLIFVNSNNQRLIALPKMKNTKIEEKCDNVIMQSDDQNFAKLLMQQLDKNTSEKIELFMKIKKYCKLEYAVIDLIKKGLLASKDELLQALKNEFEE